MLHPSFHSISQPDTAILETGTFFSMTTNRECYTPKAYVPVQQISRLAEPKFTTVFRKDTTTSSSYCRKPLSPTKSFAPVREYSPKKHPVGNTTNSEFFTAFQSKNSGGTLSAKPTPRPSSRDAAKFFAVTTTKDSYFAKKAGPTKSYAPPKGYTPNDAPLGTTTSRDEYPNWNRR